LEEDSEEKERIEETIEEEEYEEKEEQDEKEEKDDQDENVEDVKKIKKISPKRNKRGDDNNNGIHKKKSESRRLSELIESAKKSVEFQNDPNEKFKSKKRKINNEVSLSLDYNSSPKTKTKLIFSKIYFILSFGTEAGRKGDIEELIQKYGGKIIEDEDLNDMDKFKNKKMVFISPQPLRTKKMLISLSLGIGKIILIEAILHYDWVYDCIKENSLIYPPDKSYMLAAGKLLIKFKERQLIQNLMENHLM
jgi:hypothetical protein